MEKAQSDADIRPPIVHPDIRARLQSDMSDEDLKKALKGIVEFGEKS